MLQCIGDFNGYSRDISDHYMIILTYVPAYKLREAFNDRVDIEIFEKNHDVGGTWLENRYPGLSEEQRRDLCQTNPYEGCACDVPSHIYQYTFCPNPHWSKT